MMQTETMGKRIAAFRKRRGLTQDQLAEQLGISAQAVSKWETDLSCPDIGLLPQLAEILEVSLDDLFGVEKRPGGYSGAGAGAQGPGPAHLPHRGGQRRRG